MQCQRRQRGQKLETEGGGRSKSFQRQTCQPDQGYILVGSIGAVMAGSVFPMWGVLFAQTIDIIFRPVFSCPSADGSIPDPSFSTCGAYWNDVAQGMQDDSYVVSGYWVILLFVCIEGNVLTFWGFGMASKSLNKRIRDNTFSALLRQEVAFFGTS
jgi:ATP-binding cassette subfamily B (MDR/TAP) protein 1